jgi:hypothetical protein
METFTPKPIKILGTKFELDNKVFFFVTRRMNRRGAKPTLQNSQL